MTAIAVLTGCRDTPPVTDSAVPSGVHAADSLVHDWVATGRIAGAALRVERGSAGFSAAYGAAESYAFQEGEYRDTAVAALPPDALRRLPASRPMTTETLFDLASVTKVMATTFAVMLLVDREQVQLEAPVVRYLPDFATGDSAKARITVAHLLTHTAGLAQWRPTYLHAATSDEAYVWLKGVPLSWDVGAERHYSDLGFMVLGRMVEAVSGHRLDRFLAAELYEPLGLVATGFNPLKWEARSDVSLAATSHGNPFEYRMVHDTSFGYLVEGGPHTWNGWRRRTLVGEVNDGNAYHAFGGVAGHAGLFSNALELSQLLRLLTGARPPGADDLVRQSTVDRFMTPVSDGQALGWQVPDFAPSGSVYHTGFTGTMVLAAPSQDLRVVLLTNRQHLGVDVDSRYVDVAPLQRAVVEALLVSPAVVPG